MSYYNSSNVTYHATCNGFPINTNQIMEQGCFTQILNKYHTHLIDMVNNHSKVMQVRFDLCYPQGGSVIPSNTHIHDFNYNCKENSIGQLTKGGTWLIQG